MRVLVVEDDADEREYLAALLSAAGADVRAAGTADEALATLAWWWPDVLLSDIGLPGEDGYDLIRSVRALPRGAALPAAAVTGQSTGADRTRALGAGFRVHLAKPVDPERLLGVVRDLAALPAPLASR